VAEAGEAAKDEANGTSEVWQVLLLLLLPPPAPLLPPLLLLLLLLFKMLCMIVFVFKFSLLASLPTPDMWALS